MRPHLAHGLPPIDDKELGIKRKYGQRPPCWKVGICLCDERGRKVFSVRNKFIQVQKHLIKSDDLQTLLDLRYIVARVWGVWENPLWSEEMEDMLASYGGGQEGAVGELWYHIGNHKYSPYKSTFKRLVVDDDPLYYYDEEIQLKTHRKIIC